MSTFTLINPTTGQAFDEIHRADVDEVDEAVAQALVAQRSWAAWAPLARADALSYTALVPKKIIYSMDNAAMIGIRAYYQIRYATA